MLAAIVFETSRVIALGDDPMERVALAGSIAPIPASISSRSKAQVVRTDISAAERAETLEIEIALRMRNFDDMQARVARGEFISREEMAEKYFPTAEAYEQVAGWVGNSGLTITGRFDNHLSLFVRGTVEQIGTALRVDFARVASEDGEFTSAVTSPSAPAAIARVALGVNGLQPHVRYHHHTGMRPDSLTSNNPPFTPAQIKKAYNADTLQKTGTGQTIAIVIDSAPSDSDLASFWTTMGITQSLNNIQKIAVGSSPLASDVFGEATLDVEWASAIARGATVRVYVTTLSTSGTSRAYQAIFNDLPNQPTLNQLSLSFGINESEMSTTQAQSELQLLTTLAGSGISIFAASGDGGSNPSPTTYLYDASAPLQTQMPASDPFVTSVGGTTLSLDASGATSTETAWSGSGGGISKFYSRPAWQAGAGVPGGDKRLVPDVAAIGDITRGGYLIFGGVRYVAGGTSLSAPIWAGFCALINQARADAGLKSIGLLNSKIYQLVGDASFRDITSGGNGAYSAGNGYDLCTGVGAPKLAIL